MKRLPELATALFVAWLLLLGAWWLHPALANPVTASPLLFLAALVLIRAKKL